MLMLTGAEVELNPVLSVATAKILWLPRRFVKGSEYGSVVLVPVGRPSR